MKGKVLYTSYFLVLATITGLLVWHFQHNYEPSGKLKVQVLTNYQNTLKDSYYFGLLCTSSTEDEVFDLDDGIRLSLREAIGEKNAITYCANKTKQELEIQKSLVLALRENKLLKLMLKESLGSQVRSFFKSTSELRIDSVIIYTDELSASFLLPQLGSSKWVDIYLNENSYIAPQSAH